MINWRLEMSLEDVDLEAGILSDLQKLAAKFHLKELIQGLMELRVMFLMLTLP